MKKLVANRPKPIITDIDVIGYHKGMETSYAVEALVEGYFVLVLDFYSSGLEILKELKKELLQQYSGNSFKTQRNYREKYNQLSNCLLLEVSDNNLSVKKAPQIGWLKILYPNIENFLLSFPQIQGLNSSWQWYKKGINIPVIGKKIYPWYGTYFPTRFEHLELFDQWLKNFQGEKSLAYDIGIGSGVLSLQLHKYGFSNIIGTDTNPNAIIGLKDFIKTKNLGKHIQLKYGDLFVDEKQQADLIIFNPPWLPINRNVIGIDQAMYYPEDLFPRFFEQAYHHLKPNGRLVIIFSNLAQITQTTHLHPVEEELGKNKQFLQKELLKKKVKNASKSTKRILSYRGQEEVELWVLGKRNKC